ncbi:hypothetical protein [Ligilactobacillus sp. WC1T17]
MAKKGGINIFKRETTLDLEAITQGVIINEINVIGDIDTDPFFLFGLLTQ